MRKFDDISLGDAAAELEKAIRSRRRAWWMFRFARVSREKHVNLRARRIFHEFLDSALWSSVTVDDGKSVLGLLREARGSIVRDQEIRKVMEARVTDCERLLARLSLDRDRPDRLRYVPAVLAA